MKRYFNLTVIICTLLLTGTITSTAQIRTFGKFLATSDEDAEYLLKAHLSPYMNAFGASMTGGWYNTAKPHKFGGFDLTIAASVAVVPEEYRTYQLDPDNLTYLTTENGETVTTPTIAGVNEEGPQLMFEYDGLTDSAYKLPPGTDFSFVPSPIIQLGLGLFKGTEIVGRYLPQVGVEDQGKFGFWGVGIRHDIKQWIPGIKNMPILNLSVMAGYSQMNSYIVLDAVPARMGLDPAGFDPTLWDNQRLVASARSFTANLVASADIPVVGITVYGGAGFAYTKGKLAFEGAYPRIIYDPLDEQAIPVIEAREIPFELEVENQDGGFIKPRLNVGVRFKVLKVMTLSVDYTKANFNVYTAGLGITLR
ncbi:MAG: hypothetical protein JW801_01105 [Bacteroidales bacterium]|nr:hypothetical protein [Bacteroidales bacterium]